MKENMKPTKAKTPQIQWLIQQVEDYMRENPMSYAQMSKVLGLNYNTTLQVLRGETSMSKKTACRLERFIQDIENNKTQREQNEMLKT